MTVETGTDPRLTGRLNLESMHGIEIGALYNPRIRKSAGDISYLDHETADGLRAKYADNPIASVHSDAVVDVDFVLRPGHTLREAVGAAAPFDYAVAAHVFEHLPNPLGWLNEVGEILTPTGFLCLVIPDKRYCFDARRETTTPAQLVDSYLRSLTRPSFHQIFDHHTGFLGDVSPPDLWAGNVDPQQLRRQDVADPVVFAYERCKELEATGAYEDVHCSSFTPTSFVTALETFAALSLLPFEVVDLFPTEPGSFEFFATLQRSDDPARIRQSIAWAAEQAADPASPSERGESMIVSTMEKRAIELKRRVMTRARRLFKPARRNVR